MREYWSLFDHEGYETMINDLKYFKHEEFDSPDLPGSGANMNPDNVMPIIRSMLETDANR